MTPSAFRVGPGPIISFSVCSKPGAVPGIKLAGDRGFSYWGHDRLHRHHPFRSDIFPDWREYQSRPRIRDWCPFECRGGGRIDRSLQAGLPAAGVSLLSRAAKLTILLVRVRPRHWPPPWRLGPSTSTSTIAAYQRLVLCQSDLLGQVDQLMHAALDGPLGNTAGQRRRPQCPAAVNK